MTARFRSAVAPLYLFSCLVLGGSAQGMWGLMVLQLGGLAIIAWAVLAPGEQPLAAPARQLLLLSLCAIAYIAVQLVPLPPAIWSGLGGRGQLFSDYRLLGVAEPWLPISLAPAQTLDALLKLIPPLAILCALLSLKAYRPVWMTLALLAGTFAGILLGALQVSTAGSTTAPWYLYAETNRGVAVGFFANANHMATLLLISVPLLAALVRAATNKNLQRYSAFAALAGGAALVLLVGIGLNGSLAAYALLLPVLAGAVLILVAGFGRGKLWVLGAMLLLMCAGAAVIGSGAAPFQQQIQRDATVSVDTRAEMFATTMKAAADVLPFGAGFGTFRDVYHLYEDPAAVTNTYVVHAHDDYAELLLELGLPGLALIVAFLLWWVLAVWRVWRSAEAGPFVRAATIGSAIILVHSSVDFPLRTAAIAACMAMFTGLLADRRAPPVAEATDLRPTRHFVFA